MLICPKQKPHVDLSPHGQKIVKDPVVVKVEPVPIKLEQLVKQEQADYDETDYSYTCETASDDSPPVAMMAFEIGSDSDVVVEVDSPTVHPDERTTMSRKHRRTVLDGLDALNQHDSTMQSSIWG